MVLIFSSVQLIGSILSFLTVIIPIVIAVIYKIRLLKNFEQMAEKTMTKDVLRDLRLIEGYIFQIDRTLLQLSTAAGIMLAIILF